MQFSDEYLLCRTSPVQPPTGDGGGEFGCGGIIGGSGTAGGAGGIIGGSGAAGGAGGIIGIGGIIGGAHISLKCPAVVSSKFPLDVETASQMEDDLCTIPMGP